MADSESKTTTDHEIIQKWAEERNGQPAFIRGTGDGEVGVLRIDFKGFGAGEEILEPIGWEEFFEKFEKEKLAFLYKKEKTSGEQSTFFKFVERD